MKNGHGDKVNLSAYGQRNTKESLRMPDLLMVWLEQRSLILVGLVPWVQPLAMKRQKMRNKVNRKIKFLKYLR